MRIRKLTVAAGIAAVMGVAALGVWGHTAFAVGSNGDPPLIYSGTLTDQGTPANGSYQIALNLRSTADTTTNANELCSVGPVAVDVVSGQFQLPLADTCKVALQNNTTVYYEMVVNGTSLGAAQVGAVPYAEFSVVASKIQRAAGIQLGNGGLATTYTSGPSYCGSTAPTAGAFSATDSSGRALTGIAAAKEMCRSACGGSLTAHLCSQAELKQFEDTVGYPAAVPADGWILVEPWNYSGGSFAAYGPCNFATWGQGCSASLSGAYTMSTPPVPSSCTYSQAGAQYTLDGQNWGATYGPTGISSVAAAPTCDQMFPIHCCE